MNTTSGKSLCVSGRPVCRSRWNFRYAVQDGTSIL